MNSFQGEPKFGINYDVGYIGFSYNPGDIVNRGITFFEGWERLGEIKVAHAFVVYSMYTCIEAHLDTGVHQGSLQEEYFDNTKQQVFFRKPKGWTEELGNRIAQAANDKVGATYATELIVKDAIEDTFMGRIFNKTLFALPNYLVDKLLNRPNRFICSQLAAYALQMQPEFQDRGILSRPLDDIDPQALFEDRVLFEPWSK